MLLHLVSAGDLPEGDMPLNLCVFNKKQLHQVQVHRAGFKGLAVDYTKKLSGTEARTEGQIETVKFSFRTRSLAGKDDKAEPFSFLGLKGDFDLYVERNSKIPVQIEGQIPGLGEVKFRLQKVELRP